MAKTKELELRPLVPIGLHHSDRNIREIFATEADEANFKNVGRALKQSRLKAHVVYKTFLEFPWYGRPKQPRCVDFHSVAAPAMTSVLGRCSITQWIP